MIVSLLMRQVTERLPFVETQLPKSIWDQRGNDIPAYVVGKMRQAIEYLLQAFTYPTRLLDFDPITADIKF